MPANYLDLKKTKEMFIFLSEKMIENKDVLTQADKVIGDGDHGVGMARGFEAVKDKLENSEFTNLGDMLSTIGMSLLTSIGGAAGAIFGEFFRGGGKNLKNESIFDSLILSQMLNDGLEAVKKRGKASIGDKTMIDALEPATLKARESRALSLKEASQNVASAAKEGMESTKNMIAKVGKAKTLGERSIGHADPGAISTCLILKYLSAFINAQ